MPHQLKWGPSRLAGKELSWSHVGGAEGFLGFGFGFGKRGEQHPGEDGDDRNDHEQFDESECCEAVRSGLHF